MRLYAGRTSAPEDLDPAPQEEARKPRPAFGASVWFAVSQGRADGAEPRRLLPMVCNAGNITKDDIGAIRIQQSESFVEIRQESAAAFEAAVGPGGKLEDNIRLRKLDKAPDLSQSPREPRADYKGKKPSSGPRSASSPRPQSSPRPHVAFTAETWVKTRDARPDFSENRKPRDVKTERSKPDPRPERTRPEGVVEPRKPKKPAGAKPQPAHKKAAYSNDKPKAAPKDGPKPGGYKDKGGDRPKGKAEPRSKGKEGGFSKPRSASGATGKSNKRSGAAAAPSGGGDASKRYRAAANDTSKRFVPPGGKASARPPRAVGSKGAGKLRVSKGPNAVPRRSK